MPNKTGFIKPNRPMFKKPSKFETKWGKPAYKIAERENVSTTTIHMRVKNYGSPYQRKAKPNVWEAKYGKTIVEIAYDLLLSPQTVSQREKTYGNPYCEDKVKKGGPNRNKKTDKFKNTKHWSELDQFKGDIFWLMPEHPDYQQERDRALEWDCDTHIALAKAKAGV